jgi:hypothetical protein
LLNPGKAALEHLPGIVAGIVIAGQGELERKRGIVEAAVQPMQQRGNRDAAALV